MLDWFNRLFKRFSATVSPEGDLCVPLRYKIGIDNPPGEAGVITMCSFKTTHAPSTLAAWYLNIYVEEGELAAYGPYRDKTDTADQYDEGVPVFGTTGFWKNIDRQLAKITRLGGKYIETDNRDAYRNSDILKLFDYIAKHRLKIFLKNPGMSDFEEDSTELMRHPAVVGAIIEKGSITPGTLHAMRIAVGKPQLPLWFVSFNDGKGGLNWAQQCAQQILASQITYAGVTYSGGEEEYDTSRDVLIPIAKF